MQHISRNFCLHRVIPFSQTARVLHTLVHTSEPKSSDMYGEQQGRKEALEVAPDWRVWLRV